MRKVSHLLAFVLVTAIAGKAMAGKSVEVVKVSDQSLGANFSYTVSLQNGVINSAVEVSWNSSVIRTNGSPTNSSFAMVSFRYVDTSTGDDVTMSGFIQPANGSVANDLAHGHFDGVIPVSTEPAPDGSSQTATLIVNINFTATGPATKFQNRSISLSGGVLTVNNFSTSSRPGTATGTVSGKIPLIHGSKFLNLISGASQSAQIGKDANGTITITKNTR